MHKKIIIEAFQKAKKREEIKGIRKPSKHRLSKVLSSYILNEMQFPIGERSLKNYLDKGLEIEATDGDINISQLKVINGLCKFLGYKNYEDYILDQKKDGNTENGDVEYINGNGKSTAVIKMKNKKLFTWFSNVSSCCKYLIVFISTAVFAIKIFTVGIVIIR